MTTSVRPRAELLAEIEELRFRLEEAEETLRAIGSGQVDAFVVSGAGGDQVFTLRGAEQPYRILVETMNEGAATLAADGTILYCNQRLAALLQAPLEELLGTQLGDYVAPADLAVLSARLETCARDCDSDEINLVTRRGGLVPVLISCCAHELSGSRGISLVVTDLTQQRRNEAVLASEKLARSIIEQAGEAIIVCDREGNIIRASRLAHDLCGANPLLKPFNDLFRLQIQDTDCFFSVETPLKGGSFESVEVEFRRQDQQSFQLVLNATPLRSAGDPIIGCVVTLTDITERKQSEEALRESEERLALALEGGHMGLWEWDTRSDRLVWNATEYRLLGLAVGQGTETARLFFDRVHPDDLGPFNKVLADLMEKGRDFHQEFRITRADDGEVRWLVAAGRLFRDHAGQPLKMVGVNYDITDQKQAKEALKQINEELETRVRERTAQLEANIEKLKVETAERLQAVEALREKEQLLVQQSRQAAMGEMIGNIAHQWRQPLNALGLTVQQLELVYDLDAFSREFLIESVNSSMELINHMSQTIDDFRNYFRPDKDKTEFKVSEAIASTLSLIEDSFKNQHIQVEVAVTDDPVIFGYRNEFAQVLLNILNNARDALNDREWSEPRVTVTACSQEGKTVVTVSDNAGGIPDDIIDKIFDPYFTTKGPQQGTGVGLFMSKTIIEKNMGGAISVHNTPDGAEFRIEVNNAK